MQEWLKKNAPVDGEDLERHDKWLAMMWPRLHLLKELLADDGVIFVSIDDHEQHHLRMLMDEVFSSDCFVGCLAAVINLKGSRDNRGFANTHEYVLIYERTARAAKLHDLPANQDGSEAWMEDEIGSYKIGANLKYSGEDGARERRPNLFYPIYVANDGTVTIERHSEQDTELWPIADRNREVRWRWSRETVRANASEVIAIRLNSGWSLFKKQRPAFGAAPTEKPKATFYAPNYSATTATNLVKSIFDDARIFDYPKSPFFIADLLRIATDPNDIILDSFAGSGTTAHAVLTLNKEDGGNRKFILVECEDYADTVTAERVRRVIEGVPAARDKSLKEGLGGSFTYATLGEPLDIDSLLTGENLPAYETLASWLLHTATGLSAPEKELPRGAKHETGLFHSTETTNFHLLYRPDSDWLRSNEGMLNEDKARRISELAQENGRRAIVFAPGKYMGQRELTDKRITFAQLPYELQTRLTASRRA